MPVAELEQDADMVAAATKIQAVHRGRAARKGRVDKEEAASAPAPARAPAPAPAPAERPARAKFCDYMAAHGMEQRLRAALRELNDARPEDPAAFVARQLLGPAA